MSHAASSNSGIPHTLVSMLTITSPNTEKSAPKTTALPPIPHDVGTIAVFPHGDPDTENTGISHRVLIAEIDPGNKRCGIHPKYSPHVEKNPIIWHPSKIKVLRRRIRQIAKVLPRAPQGPSTQGAQGSF